MAWRVRQQQGSSLLTLSMEAGKCWISQATHKMLGVRVHWRSSHSGRLSRLGPPRDMVLAGPPLAIAYNGVLCHVCFVCFVQVPGLGTRGMQQEWPCNFRRCGFRDAVYYWSSMVVQARADQSCLPLSWVHLLSQSPSAPQISQHDCYTIQVHLGQRAFTCRASLVGLRVRNSSWPMGERPLRRLMGAWGPPVQAGVEGDRAPVLLGFPAELALTRSDALFTGALGLGVSCISCACEAGLEP